MKNFEIVQAEQDFKNLRNEYLRFPRINSTNKYLMDSDLKHGSVVWSDFQTRGRGRKDRKWLSSHKQNLLFSILLKDNLDRLSNHIYTFLAAIAVHQTLQDYTTDIDPALKWPNDVLINSKKLCGILVETKTSSQRMTKVVLGIGLNVNQEQEYFNRHDLLYGTSLYIETGRKHDRKEIFENCLNNFDLSLELALEQGESLVMDLWRKYCPHISEEITINTGNGSRTGIFQDIANDGALILKSGDEVQKFYAGDVSFQKRSL